MTRAKPSARSALGDREDDVASATRADPAPDAGGTLLVDKGNPSPVLGARVALAGQASQARSPVCERLRQVGPPDPWVALSSLLGRGQVVGIDEQVHRHVVYSRENGEDVQRRRVEAPGVDPEPDVGTGADDLYPSLCVCHREEVPVPVDTEVAWHRGSPLLCTLAVRPEAGDHIPDPLAVRRLGGEVAVEQVGELRRGLVL